MITAVADTHAVIWYLYNDKRLSQTAGAFIDAAASQGNQIGVSAITLIEVIYLSEKGRISSEALSKVTAVLQNPRSILVEVPFDLAVAQVVPRITWASVQTCLTALLLLHLYTWTCPSLAVMRKFRQQICIQSGSSNYR